MAMMFLSDFAKALRTIAHPRKNTKDFMYLGQAFRYYYRMTIVPAIILIVIGLVFEYYTIGGLGISSSTAYNYGFTGFLGLFAMVVIGFWILNPIRIVVFSGIVHMFGSRIFKFFGNSFERTLSAQIYAISPVLVLAWSALFSIAGISVLYAGSSTYNNSAIGTALILAVVGFAIAVIAQVWSFIISMIALSNQQGIGKLKAFSAMACSGVLAFAIILAVGILASSFMGINFFSIFGSMYQFL